MLRFPLLIARFLQRVGRLLDWLPPLAARISVGWVFAESGWGHLHHIDLTLKQFIIWKVPFPQFNVYLSGCTELIGGTLLMVGLLTRVVSIPLIFNMMVALAVAVIPDPHGVHSASDLYAASEYLYILLMVWLVVRGPGAVSLDFLLNYFCNPKHEASADPH
jgi:putative oxidoreductase